MSATPDLPIIGQFHLEVEITSVKSFKQAVGQRPEDYFALVADACEGLAEMGFRFSARGFGDDSWPVDVAYDLSTVMEQLPDVLQGIRNGQKVELDFYGPGIERSVAFAPNGDQVLLRCASRTRWQPDPADEMRARSDIERMLTKLAVDFSLSLDSAKSPLADAEPFSAWRLGRVWPRASKA